MNQVVLAAPGRAEVRPAPAPPPPTAGEVVVAVDRVTLCGSDYKLFHGSYGGPRRYPVRCGHEWSGTVETSGPGCRLRPGDAVTGDCSCWCGVCDLCRVDRNLCRRIEKFGITCDGFAVSRRTVAERYLYRDHFGLGADLLSLCEIFAVALRGIGRVGSALETADDLLVIGGGPLGVATYLALDRDDRGPRLFECDRRRLAGLRRTFPALRTASPPSADPSTTEAGLSTYHELLNEGHYSVVFDCSGTGDGLAAALRAVRPHGTVVCYGLGQGVTVDSARVVVKALTLVGSIGGTGAFPKAMELLAKTPETARMITHRFPSSRAQEAFTSTAEEPEKIKVQLLIGGHSR